MTRNKRKLMGIGEYSRATTSNYQTYCSGILDITEDLHPRVQRFYNRIGGIDAWESLKIKLGLEKNLN